MSPRTKRVIAFAGPKTAGKDTAAKALLSRNSFEPHLKAGPIFQQENFGDSVKSVCTASFGLTHEEMYDSKLKEVPLTRWPHKSPRELMQHVAKVFRTMYGGNIWAQRWDQKIQDIKAGAIVLTDLRHPEELEVLNPLDHFIIYVHNPVVEQVRAKGIAEGDPLWTDASEAFAEQMRLEADATITNTLGDLNGLYTQVQDAVQTRFGHWNTWG